LESRVDSNPDERLGALHWAKSKNSNSPQIRSTAGVQTDVEKKAICKTLWTLAMRRDIENAKKNDPNYL
jgi:hypothetical protein